MLRLPRDRHSLVLYKNQQAIAPKCYAELAPEGDWESDFYAQGKFLDTTVFKLWRSLRCPEPVEGSVAEERLPTSIENWQDSNIVMGDELWRSPTPYNNCAKIEETTIYPTARQALMCLLLCQSLSSLYRDIQVFRFNEQRGYVFIMAGDELQILVFSNGTWRFINET